MFALFIHHLSKIADWQSKACKLLKFFNQRTLKILLCLTLVTRLFCNCLLISLAFEWKWEKRCPYFVTYLILLLVSVYDLCMKRRKVCMKTKYNTTGSQSLSYECKLITFYEINSASLFISYVLAI